MPYRCVQTQFRDTAVRNLTPDTQYDFGTNPVRGASGQAAAISPRVARQDPVIYPGLYSASGLDVMSVLVSKSFDSP